MKPGITAKGFRLWLCVGTLTAAVLACSALQPSQDEIAQEILRLYAERTGTAMALASIPPTGTSTTAPTNTPRVRTRTPTITPTLGPPTATPTRDTNLAYSTIDRPDDYDGYQVHIIYLIPRDGDDGFLDVNGQIEISVLAMNNWLRKESGGHGLRMDTFGGALDISFLRSRYSTRQFDATGVNLLEAADFAIQEAGFNDPRKIYVIYYDGQHNSDGYCGIGYHPPQAPGKAGIVLLRGYIPEYGFPCPRSFTQSESFTGFFELAVLHEILHVLGAVPDCAPSNQHGHVDDSVYDLMYFTDPPGGSSPSVVLDYRHDDYFGHGIEDCLDLARSIFLDPLPDNPELPPSWDESVEFVPENPFD